MAASSLDKISKISTGDIPAVATVTAPRSAGVTALSVDTQLNWATDTGIKFSTFQVDPNKLDAYGNPTKIPNSQIDWKGVSNGTNAISNIIRTAGATDTGNAVGDKVVMLITAQWGEDIAEAMLVSHSQTGSLLPAAVQTAIGTGGITNTNLATGILSSKFFIPYKFSSYANVSTTLLPGVFTKVLFNAEEYDTGNVFDAVTNSRFTVPTGGAGFYKFDASVEVTSSASESYVIALYKNGVQFKHGTKSAVTGSGTASFTISSPLLQLADTDYVEIYLYNGSGGNKATTVGQSLCWFSGYMASNT